MTQTLLLSKPARAFSLLLSLFFIDFLFFFSFSPFQRSSFILLHDSQLIVATRTTLFLTAMKQYKSQNQARHRRCLPLFITRPSSVPPIPTHIFSSFSSIPHLYINTQQCETVKKWSGSSAELIIKSTEEKLNFWSLIKIQSGCSFHQHIFSVCVSEQSPSS